MTDRTDDERMAAAIEWLEQHDREGEEFVAREPGRMTNEKWRADVKEALAILRAARPCPDALARVRTVARLRLGGDSVAQRFLWSKIAGRMGYWEHDL